MSQNPNAGPGAGDAPSPMLLFTTVNAFQSSAAIRAAVDLEVFTAIAEGHTTPAALAERCNAAERGLRILCDNLVILGFLTKGEGSYQLTRDSAIFLDRRSPAYMGGIVEFMHSPSILDSFTRLTEAVRRGGTATSEEGTMAPDHPVWVDFARAMMPMMGMAAKALPDLVPVDPEKPLRVLDIAAGHGLFGLAFAERYPQAEVTAVDWEAVLAVAQENAEHAGVANRFRTLPGSAFDVDYGGEYDVILLTNFLHHFDVPTCETLLRKVHASLAEGGKAVTLEFVPNDDRVTPPGPASFSLVMLASTAAGDAYTFAELESMFGNAGFSRSEASPVPAGIETVVVSYK